MSRLRTKIEYYKKTLLEENDLDASALEIFITKHILHRLDNPSEDIEYALAIFNELANLRQESIDEILGMCFYINLWNEYEDRKEMFWHYLNDRSKKLNEEAVFLYTKGATREEQVRYRKENGL